MINFGEITMSDVVTFSVFTTTKDTKFYEKVYC